MRRSLVPSVTLLFAAAAFVGAALPTAGLAALVTGLGRVRLSPTISGILGLVAVAFDVLWLRGSSIARPWSVLRQVPGAWGHEHGPWQAAARYGLRMGFGPATILTTWTWWAGFVIVVLTGWKSAVIGSAVFAFARALTMMIGTVGPRTGDEMARRAARIGGLEATARILGLLLVAGASSFVVLSSALSS